MLGCCVFIPLFVLVTHHERYTYHSLLCLVRHESFSYHLVLYNFTTVSSLMISFPLIGQIYNCSEITFITIWYKIFLKPGSDLCYSSITKLSFNSGYNS